MWAACDECGVPSAYLVGSANLTAAGLAENVELMAVADPSEHDYLRGVLEALLDKSWHAKDQLVGRVAGPDAAAPAERLHRRTPRSSQRRHKPAAATAQTGCAKQAAVLMASVLGLATAALALAVRASDATRRPC